MSEQEPKRVKIEKPELIDSQTQRISYYIPPANSSLSVEGLRHLSNFNTLRVAIRDSHATVPDAVRNRLNLKYAETLAAGFTPETNTKFFSEQFGPAWSSVQSCLQQSSTLSVKFMDALRNGTSAELIVKFIPLAANSTPKDESETRLVKDCPLSGRPIKYAVRSRLCSHYQCFDLEAYLKYCTQHLVPTGQPGPLVDPPKIEPVDTASKLPKIRFNCPVCAKVPLIISYPWYLERDVAFEKQVQEGQQKKSEVSHEILVID